MRSAGLYSPQNHRAYFEQVALHLANAIRVFHLKNRPGAVNDLARRQIGLDDSIRHLEDAAKVGRGVLLAPAHTVNFILTLARLNQAVPVCIFLRWSNDARRLRLKQQWCEAAGLKAVMEPASSLSATSRAAICVDVLRSGAVLAITPDVAQKTGEGAAVTLFGRRVYLPTGAAAIAKIAEAPIIPLFGRLENDKQILYCEPPISVETLPRDRGGRKLALQRAMQTWAVSFEAFVRRCPAAWFLWGDSRWTRVFEGDPEYTGEGTASEPEAPAPVSRRSEPEAPAPGSPLVREGNREQETGKGGIAESTAAETGTREGCAPVP